MENCTFKPDFSKTQAITEKYLNKQGGKRASVQLPAKRVNKKMLRQFVNCKKENIDPQAHQKNSLVIPEKYLSEQKEVVIRGDDAPIQMIVSSRQETMVD